MHRCSCGRHDHKAGRQQASLVYNDRADNYIWKRSMPARPKFGTVLQRSVNNARNPLENQRTLVDIDKVRE